MGGIFTVMALGGEVGGCEGGGGKAMCIAAMEGGPGGGWSLMGIRKCGVDACVRRVLLLRCGMVSCVWAVYGDSKEGMPICEKVDRVSGFVVR